MKKLRKRIREVLLEVFDDISNIPSGLTKEEGGDFVYYKFQYNGMEYVVEFYKIKGIGEYQMPHKELRDFIIKNANGFSISFGIVKNGVYSDFINTDKHEAIRIISYIWAIMKQFVAEHDVNVITFFAEKSRDKIYKYICDKHLKKDFEYYTANNAANFNRFYIKKDFYNKFKQSLGGKEKI